MAIPDGKPATDFSAMNREWVRAVAAEAAEGGGGGGGIPAPENPSDGDVLTYSSADEAWVAAAPSGGGGNVVINADFDSTSQKWIMDKTFSEISALFASNTFMLVVLEAEESWSVNKTIGYITSVYVVDGEIPYYTVGTTAENLVFSTDSENGYPHGGFD